MKGHEPDLAMIPLPLQCLDWQPMVEQQWWNGDELLVAVPITDQRWKRSWYYEMSVVRIDCDEAYFCVKLDDEIWGWELTDCDYYVKLR